LIEKFQSSRVLSYVSVKQQDASHLSYSPSLSAQPLLRPTDCFVPTVKQQDASHLSYSPSLSAQPLLRPTALCQPSGSRMLHIFLIHFLPSLCFDRPPCANRQAAGCFTSFLFTFCPALAPSDRLMPTVKQQDASHLSYSLSAQPLLRPTALCQPSSSL